MTTLPLKDLFRPDEVAEYFSISRVTVYRWIKQGKIEAIKVDGIIKIRKEAIVKYNAIMP